MLAMGPGPIDGIKPSTDGERALDPRTRRGDDEFPGLPVGAIPMKRSLFAMGLMIGAAILGRAVLAQQPGQPGRGGPPNPLLQAFDTDRDGTLSAAEIDAAAAKLRERDANKDGKLTADELPRGQGGRGGPGGPGSGRGRGPGAMEADSDLSKPPLPKDDGERRILAALEQARQGQRYANVSTADGRLLRQLTESIGAKRVVELGTSTGESGLWFSMALRKTGGKLYTHDIDPGRLAVARENFKRASVEDLITIVEGDAHETAVRNRDPIDILFIDAEKEGYDAYLKELLPYVRPGGLILAHNMRRPAPNPRYVEAITTRPDLDTSFVLMDGAGVGITLKKR
jgi:predicted O-methyltransferase YrrM